MLFLNRPFKEPSRFCAGTLEAKSKSFKGIHPRALHRQMTAVGKGNWPNSFPPLERPCHSKSEPEFLTLVMSLLPLFLFFLSFTFELLTEEKENRWAFLNYVYYRVRYFSGAYVKMIRLLLSQDSLWCSKKILNNSTPTIWCPFDLFFIHMKSSFN